MPFLEGEHFIIGNFEDETIQQKILDIIGLEKFDIILSDMAPNTSGKQSLDHLRIMNLCESVLEYAKNYLSYNGTLITKIFKGSEEQRFVLELKQFFSSVKYCKPESSRKESNEIYLVCQGFKN